MLVLSRKLGERIIIGDGITVSIVRINGNRIQLGIEAPLTVSIKREEIRSRDSLSTESVAAESISGR